MEVWKLTASCVTKSPSIPNVLHIVKLTQFYHYQQQSTKQLTELQLPAPKERNT